MRNKKKKGNDKNVEKRKRQMKIKTNGTKRIVEKRKEKMGP